MNSGGTAIRGLAAGITLAALAAAIASPAAAQTAQNVPNAVQGFSQNREAPVQIEALSLEVREKEKIATFTGDVNVVQGDTTMKCKALVVFYDGEKEGGGDSSGGKSGSGRKGSGSGGGAPMKAANPGPSGSQQIRRLEAKGGVIITQLEQTASGDTGIFDMQANTITLAGNVVVTQGKNILRGDRLVVDMTSGVSRVESGNAGDGRVRALIQPGSVPKPDAQAKSEAKPDGQTRTGAIRHEAEAKPDTRKPVPPRPAN
jgi:lipopolysaccharide export system protein LptA